MRRFRKWPIGCYKERGSQKKRNPNKERPRNSKREAFFVAGLAVVFHADDRPNHNDFGQVEGIPPCFIFPSPRRLPPPAAPRVVPVLEVRFGAVEAICPEAAADAEQSFPVIGRCRPFEHRAHHGKAKLRLEEDVIAERRDDERHQATQQQEEWNFKVRFGHGCLLNPCHVQ